ncbi:probable N-acetyltransferase camello isoform X2 [Pseudorasbora parva]|uniref:probable N-acetyltransferase camello isoform X2 n=1 Tax=Pseudorasbora parva TaxID=51549 RepID=UPI00351E692F
MADQRAATFLSDTIREYRDADYSSVRTLYSTGFREHVGNVYRLALKQPCTQAMLCGVFLLIYIFSSSFLTCIMGVGGVMLAGRMAVQYIFEQGIRLGLNEDLLDIRNSYMQTGSRSCFWVAELKGSIVGTVGILPCVEETGAWELKRISVKREFRGRGLAKALCKSAMEFVARHDVKRVVLFTSVVQTDAHKLYDSIGFKKEKEFVWPSLPARLINFVVFKYAHSRTGCVISC